MEWTFIRFWCVWGCILVSSRPFVVHQMLYIRTGKNPNTWHFWNLKIPKYKLSKNIVFMHFLKIVGPWEKELKLTVSFDHPVLGCEKNFGHRCKIGRVYILDWFSPPLLATYKISRPPHQIGLRWVQLFFFQRLATLTNPTIQWWEIGPIKKWQPLVLGNNTDLFLFRHQKSKYDLLRIHHNVYLSTIFWNISEHISNLVLTQLDWLFVTDRQTHTHSHIHFITTYTSSFSSSSSSLFYQHHHVWKHCDD